MPTVKWPECFCYRCLGGNSSGNEFDIFFEIRYLGNVGKFRGEKNSDVVRVVRLEIIFKN